ncbi:MAG: thioether cross-link-forming SCIFF peptide maturase [Firmicutes bacterium]|nr:thioether cross-link-forming SCIFF peptide maturase [Bacillota bacterium]
MRLVVDVVSGAVHVVDEPTWDLLDALRRAGGDQEAARAGLRETHPDSLLDEVQEEIARLAGEGALFTRDPWRDKGIPGPEPASPARPVIKSLCLHLAHDCNLRCAYCFGGGGGFGGRRGLMPPEVAKAAVDFLIDYSGERSRCEIDFFGGEPLLNPGVLKETVGYARRRGNERGKSFNLTLTTNAVLLDEPIRDFLNQNGISLVLSLDGRREVHDRMRVQADGSGSYDEVLENARAMVESRGHENYYIRGTYTRMNRDFAEDVLHMADLGFRHISVEPVVLPEGGEYALTEEDLPTLLAEYERLAAACRDRAERGAGFRFFHFDLDLDHGPCLPKRVKGCGAGSEYLAITPEGDIYPCHQFVGRPRYLMGNVMDSSLDLKTVESFRRADLLHKDPCRRCWVRFYCGGGCHANAEAFNGSLHQPYSMGCRLLEKRMEAAIFLQVSARLSRTEDKGGITV